MSKVFTVDRGAAEVTVLDNVTLDLRPGEFVSLLGPSGCGKSTLLEIVAGLQTPSTGQVLVDGTVVTAPGPERSVVFQHYALFPWLTAQQNVEFPLRLAGVDKATRAVTARNALAAVGLSEVGTRYAAQLSGGMQQRVALARALVCEPSVLLMDEPFSGADAITREILQEELHDLHTRLHNTVLFVTHSVDEALHLSDRVVVLGTKPGRVVREIELDRAKLDATSPAERERTLGELKYEVWGLLKQIITDARTYDRR
ncbi:MAG TPA: ABC transporter ATP-binding protein [Micromonosporaceae bacterium]